jgi:hypothetical protein
MRISRIQHDLTYVPIHITSRYENEDLAVGSAFFYTHENRDYLITNWHNVTGRRPWDKSHIHPCAALPDNLVIRFPIHENQEGGTIAYKWAPRVLKLYEDDDRLKPIWWEHPEHGYGVDAVAVAVEIEEIEGLSETKVVAANAESLSLDLLQLIPGMDVFILGFPRGISGGGRFPLWKRGSIASEPDVHI